MTTINELEESQKRYTVELSNHVKFEVSGEEKSMVMNARSQFVELRNGEVLNKSFIVSIILNKERTREDFIKLQAINERRTDVEKSS